MCFSPPSGRRLESWDPSARLRGTFSQASANAKPTGKGRIRLSEARLLRFETQWARMGMALGGQSRARPTAPVRSPKEEGVVLAPRFQPQTRYITLFRGIGALPCPHRHRQVLQTAPRRRLEGPREPHSSGRRYIEAFTRRGQTMPPCVPMYQHMSDNQFSVASIRPRLGERLSAEGSVPPAIGRISVVLAGQAKAIRRIFVDCGDAARSVAMARYARFSKASQPSRELCSQSPGSAQGSASGIPWHSPFPDPV